jgi:hypothetical protein
MSKLVLSGDTSGSVTLDAPAVSGTTTLTLPTTSGTVVVTSGAQTIEFADGSASAPSITNSGDTNTGIFFPAADTIAFAEGGAEAMRLDSSGNVGIGTTSPVSGCKATIVQSANGQCVSLADGGVNDSGFYGVLQITRVPTPADNRLHIAMVRNGNIVGGFGYVNNSNTMFVGNAGTTNSNGMTLTANATAWGSQSDERVKNIHGNIENAVEKIGEWRTVYFNYKIDEEGSKQRVGLIAQDVEKTAPEVVDSIGDEQDTLQVRYTEVIPFLVKAIQEQQTIIETLKLDISELKAKVGE